MTANKFSRRNLLWGAGGVALAIPVLESLQPREARAGGSVSPRRFVALRNPHGGCWESALFGSPTPTETTAYAGHTIRRTDLAATDDGVTAALSEVLRAAATDLSPALVAKINLIQGIDSIVHVGHNRGGFLGNPNATDDPDTAAATTARPTIDQVLAWSDWFYDDLSTILERSLHVGGGLSYGWSSPQSASGTVQEMGSSGDPLQIFNLVFVPDAGVEANPRPLIVDRVLAEYLSLRQGNRRLSPADRQRLDDHMERIDELQRKLEIVVDCGTASPPDLASDIYPWGPGYFGDVAKNLAYWQAVNEVVAVAFACDTSRIAVLEISEQSVFSAFGGDWHQDVAHRAELMDVGGVDELPQTTLRGSYQQIFENVFLDLARRLDSDDGSGSTFLDNSLVVWGMESGPSTHDCTSMPLVTAGSAGGKLRTGQHLDYRNQNSPYVNEWNEALAPGGEPVLTGLTTNQFLGTVLQALGLPPEAYESGAAGGYGEASPSANRAAFYPASVLSKMGEALPWLLA